MPIVPLYGHDALRARLLEKVRTGELPQSLLLHGPPGVGKQRLALWIGQALLCRTAPVPCGTCRHCRYALDLVHPDLTWVFPRPRPRDSDRDADDIKHDLATASHERAEAHGLYPSPSGADGIFVATTKFILRQAAMTPAMASRKVFVVGDADRLVLQEGSELAANAILKLLEEPPADTTIIVTSSAVGALMPTIRSRVVAVRVPRMTESAVQAFLADPMVEQALNRLGLPKGIAKRVALADGAPGKLLAAGVRQTVLDEAQRLLETALSKKRADMLRLAFVQGQRGARGGFSDVLDALTVTLHERVQTRAVRGDQRAAASAARAIDLVEDAKLLADGNVNPQLITAKLLRDLSTVLS
jgi:DNA polymerase-3 subunit delta'